VRESDSLRAEGTAENRVVFTAETQSPGFWNGIQFTFSNNVNNVLDYVTVEYGGAPINGEGNVVLSGNNTLASSATITNSRFQFRSTYGI
jgi:hypothetical protein